MKTLKITAVIVLVTLALIYRESIGNYLEIITDQESVSTYLRGFGPLGPVVLFCLLVAQVFVAVIPGHALMVTAGYVYGNIGLIVVIASTILGSQIAFTIARRYGRNLIYKLASPAVIEKWDKTARHQGILFYFFAFVLPIFPSDLMCYVAGLATIPPRRFFVSNVMGRTCCAVFVTLLGMYGTHPPVWFLVVAALGIIAIVAGWFIYKKTNLPQALNVQCNI
ncbi:MAG: TVP38/TMEM64 family protein [Anaerolineales bacterium]|nr:TVP38/TMEM64 family protein [Anaerolineales bacterium]